jgi:O-antigen ligase
VTDATLSAGNALARPWWRPEPEAAALAPKEREGLAYGALLTFLFVLLIAPQNQLAALASLRPALIAAVVAVTTCLGGRFLDRRPLSVSAPGLGLGIALGAWAILTIPLSYWPGGSVTVLLDLYLKTLALFWLLANLVDTPKRLRRVTLALTAMGVPLALTGVRHFASGAFLDDSGVKRIEGYSSGLAANPNDLALVLNLLLPLALGLALGRQALKGRVFAFLAAAVLAMGVVVTFSRAGFVTLLTTVLVYLFKLLRRGHVAPAAAVLFIAFLALPLLPQGYVARVASIASLDSDPTRSAQNRWSDIRAALRILPERPLLGVGLGMNILALNDERGTTWTAVHNVYLQLGVELGLPGLALFGALLVTSVRAARRAQRGASAAGDPELHHLAEGIEVALLAFAVSALFYPVAYHFYFYLIAGLAAAAGAMSLPPPAVPGELRA